MNANSYLSKILELLQERNGKVEGSGIFADCLLWKHKGKAMPNTSLDELHVCKRILNNRKG